MLGIIIVMALVFVAWIAFRACVGIFPFLQEYLVYVNWSVAILEILLFVAAIVLLILYVKEKHNKARRPPQ